MGFLLDVMVFAIPAVACAALSYRFRASAPPHLYIWLIGYPLLFVTTVLLTFLISFQVFGVDLID